MTATTAKTLKNYLAVNFLPHTGEAELKDDQDLFDTGVLDSASALALLFFVEEEFGIAVPDEDFLPENFASITAASTYIDGRLATGAQMERTGGGRVG